MLNSIIILLCAIGLVVVLKWVKAKKQQLVEAKKVVETTVVEPKKAEKKPAKKATQKKKTTKK